MPNNQNSLVKQADRDAVDHWERVLIGMEESITLEEAFARHRIAFSQPVGVDEEAVDVACRAFLTEMAKDAAIPITVDEAMSTPEADQLRRYMLAALSSVVSLSPHNEGDSPVLKGGYSE